MFGNRFIRNSSSLSDAFRQIVQSRKTIHQFDPSKHISKSTLKHILENTQRTPTSFNIQPYKIVIVGDKRIKKALAYSTLGGNTKKVLDAPITAVFVADLNPNALFDKWRAMELKSGKSKQAVDRLEENAKIFTGDNSTLGHITGIVKDLAFKSVSHVTQMPSINSPIAWGFKNTTMAAQTYMLSCSSYGIDTCPMEGFDDRRIREVLSIPDEYSIPIIIPTGYCLSSETKKAEPLSPRYDLEDVVCIDGFDHPLIFRENE